MYSILLYSSKILYELLSLSLSLSENKGLLCNLTRIFTSLIQVVSLQDLIRKLPHWGWSFGGRFEKENSISLM